MKAKITYVLVSSPNDVYLEQAFVSIQSVKHHMPDAHIVVIMDSQTSESLIGIRSLMLNEVNEKIVIDIDSKFTAKQKSRILKTSFRKYVEGDLLFIDCDTLILKPLDDIDQTQFELCACSDSHALFANNPYRKMCVAHCNKLGYDISNEMNYYNSGVIFAKDSKNVRDFFETWNKNWLMGMERGVLMDQPSFAVTNIQFNHFIKELSGSWNCQIIHGLKYFEQAKILHYLCTSKTSEGDQQMFLLRERDVLLKIKETGHLPDNVKALFDNIYDGFPDIVHILSGQNVKLMQSESFVFLQNNYRKPIFKVTDFVLGYLNKITKIPRYLKNYK